MAVTGGETKRVTVSYHKRRDVLFVSVDTPRAAVSDEVAPDFYLRLDRVTNEPIGFECVDFSHNIESDVWRRALPDIGVFYPLARPHEKHRLPEFLLAVWREAERGEPLLHGMSFEVAV